MGKPQAASQLRQTLGRAEHERTQHVRTLLGERGPLIRGSYVVQPTRCGKASCKCARGQPHSAAVLYRREDSVQRCFYVPREERPRVEPRARRYQHARQARAALAKLGQQSLELADALLEVLTEPYPPPDRAGRAPPSRRKKERREGSET